MSASSQIWASGCPYRSGHMSFINTTALEDKLDIKEISRRRALFIPMDGVQMPQRAWLEEGKKLPGTEFYLVSGGYMAVSDEFIDLLNEFDIGAPLSDGPGKDRVEFHPLTIDDHTMTKELDRAHILHVAVRKPCVDFEASAAVDRIGKSHLWSPGIVLEDKLVVNETAQTGADLWAAQDLTRTLFFSDRLKSAIEARGWSRIKFERCRMAE
ncbi:MAG: hypothetical protein AAF367_11270 [Pseudomonadota bacterium]